MKCVSGGRIPKNPKEALRLLTEVSVFDFPIANYCLGKMYLLGLGGTDSNSHIYSARYYFDKAVAKGSAYLVNNIGTQYGAEESALYDKVKAFQCFKRAVDLGGEPCAYHNLGIMYLEGVKGKGGTERDIPKAMDCFLKAGNLGVKAFLKLAKIYRSELENSPKNKELADLYESWAVHKVVMTWMSPGLGLVISQPWTLLALSLAI